MNIDRENQETEDELRALKEDIRIMNKNMCKSVREVIDLKRKFHKMDIDREKQEAESAHEMADQVKLLTKEVKDLKARFEEVELFLIGVLKDIVFRGYSDCLEEDEDEDLEEDDR